MFCLELLFMYYNPEIFSKQKIREIFGLSLFVSLLSDQNPALLFVQYLKIDVSQTLPSFFLFLQQQCKYKSETITPSWLECNSPLQFCHYGTNLSPIMKVLKIIKVLNIFISLQVTLILSGTQQQSTLLINIFSSIQSHAKIHRVIKTELHFLLRHSSLNLNSIK